MASEASAPMNFARRWIDPVMKIPWQVVAEHSKTMAGDHGLNRDSDAIVIRLQDAYGIASDAIPQGGY
jgi:hypothetical protein